MRNNVTFKALIPFDHGRHPIGEDVAQQLIAAIERVSGRTCTNDDWRDSGYQLSYEINGKPVHIAMVYVDNPHFDFYAQVGSYAGWFRRMLGYRDETEQEMLIATLDEALKSDHAFENIYWHDAWYDEIAKSTEP